MCNIPTSCGTLVRQTEGTRIIDTCIIAIVHDARAEDQNKIEVGAQMAPKLFLKKLFLQMCYTKIQSLKKCNLKIKFLQMCQLVWIFAN